MVDYTAVESFNKTILRNGFSVALLLSVLLSYFSEGSTEIVQVFKHLITLETPRAHYLAHLKLEDERIHPERFVSVGTQVSNVHAFEKNADVLMSDAHDSAVEDQQQVKESVKMVLANQWIFHASIEDRRSMLIKVERTTPKAMIPAPLPIYLVILDEDLYTVFSFTFCDPAAATFDVPCHLTGFFDLLLFSQSVFCEKPFPSIVVGNVYSVDHGYGLVFLHIWGPREATLTLINHELMAK